jgi:hypothetical protein
MSIIIHVDGGVVQSVFSTIKGDKTEIVVVDYDDQSETNPSIGRLKLEYLKPEYDIAKDIEKKHIYLKKEAGSGNKKGGRSKKGIQDPCKV